jgi:competence protein ComEA helix-hairpin-helix repeat region
MGRITLCVYALLDAKLVRSMRIVSAWPSRGSSAEMRMIMKKELPVIIGICMALLVISGFLFWRGQNQSAYTADALITANPLGQARQSEKVNKHEIEENAAEECAVYVSGAVRKPGVYRYRGVARVCDAIEAVGGLEKDAAAYSLNLARKLEDGEQICVLTKKEAARAEKMARREKGASGEEKNQDSPGSDSGGKVNINTATEADLMTLPGIGEAKAALIVGYREEHGKFSKIEDLMQISGIKEGIFQKIKNNITTS